MRVRVPLHAHVLPFGELLQALGCGTAAMRDAIFLGAVAENHNVVDQRTVFIDLGTEPGRAPRDRRHFDGNERIQDRQRIGTGYADDV